MLDLDADGMAPVKSVSTGDALTGGWTDCTSTYPSGDGQTVADFKFRFNVLPADADANNVVNVTDVALVYQQIGKTSGQTMATTSVTTSMAVVALHRPTIVRFGCWSGACFLAAIRPV